VNRCRTCRWWHELPEPYNYEGRCFSKGSTTHFPWTHAGFGCTLWEPASPVAHLFTEISRVAEARIAFADQDRHWDNNPCYNTGNPFLNGIVLTPA
jgi:hypothetical protein